jgi:hypothetical protein
VSKLIPRRTIDAIRQNVNVALDIAGIACTLYIPTNLSHGIAEKLDVWDTPGDLTYISYSSTVFPIWSPQTKLLKKLGLYTEGTIPILARFPFVATLLEGSGVGTEAEVDIPVKSYFRIAPEFVPDDYSGIEDFEVIDIGTESIHDSVLTQIYKIAPRRVER